MSARTTLKGSTKLVILLITVVALLAIVLSTPVGTWLRIGVISLWEGFNNLPGIAWAREQMEAGASEEVDTSVGAGLSEADAEAITAALESGQALQQEGAFEEALRRYGEALAMSDDYAPTHVALASLYLEMGREDEAMKELEKAAELAPDNSFVLEQLGRLYLRRDEYDKCVAVLLHAKEVDPENPTIRYWLGATHFFRSYDDAQNAVLELERAAELDPEDAEIRFRLALALARRDDTGDVESAIRALETTLELDPSQVDALYYLGQLYMRTGRPEEAIEVWQRYLILGEDEDLLQNVRVWLRNLLEEG